MPSHISTVYRSTIAASERAHDLAVGNNYNNDMVTQIQLTLANTKTGRRRRGSPAKGTCAVATCSSNSSRVQKLGLVWQYCDWHWYQRGLHCELQLLAMVLAAVKVPEAVGGWEAEVALDNVL